MVSLSFSNISKSYTKGKKALNRVSFSYDGNGILALIGRNGAGKTTLIRILATELMPDSGTASIDGIDLIKDPDRVRGDMSIVPQEARTIGWLTPAQNITTYLLYRGLSYKEASLRALKAMEEVGISEYKDTVTRKLSGGTKRKTLVAMILASESRLIFLDEPTTGLDPISREELWNVLNKLKKDRLIVLTTHYLEEAERLADRICVIEDGKLMAHGTMDELRMKIRYQYSIRLPANSYRPRARGRLVRGTDGGMQILTDEQEAFRVSKELIKKGIRFSSNPVSLEDIFYFIVKKSIDRDDKEGNYDEW
ncbi:MAG: ABC transporter ATP-binding protein [Candidatus Marsarchaeota archaeon]|nr:ABC transporter ATP-binding protein [Candidatus Marsarchaeota archaeon]